MEIPMQTTSAARVLILAHKTADSPTLIDAVTQRAAAGPCRFTLLVPSSPRGLHRVMDPEDHGAPEAEARLTAAVPLLTQAAGSDVVGIVGAHEPFAAVQDALNLLGFDEVIVSTLPAPLSRWLHLDLPRKISALGVTVTTVTPVESSVNDRPAA
jgi:hypothetical protein